MVENQMQKSNKKIIVILVIFVIILSGISAVSAIEIKNKSLTPEEKKSNTTVETVTLYRCGLDGSETAFEFEIQIDDETDIYEIIEKKCEELIEKDFEFQELLANRTKLNFLSMVRSRGRGIHLKISPQHIWPTRFKIFPLLLPYIFRRVRIPIIYCRYTKDPRAFTKVTPLIGGAAKTISEKHSVFSIGFYGFKWWIGCVSFLGFVLRTGFVGFSLFTRIKEF